jgi:hypothetical protein
MLPGMKYFRHPILKSGQRSAAGKYESARFFGCLGWKVEIQNVQGL